MGLMNKKFISGKLLFLAALGILLIAWERIEATELGYRVEEGRKSLEALESQASILEKNLETASSPETLSRLAGEKLQMIPAPLKSIKFMDSPPAQEIASSQNFPSRFWRKLKFWRRST